MKSIQEMHHISTQSEKFIVSRSHRHNLRAPTMTYQRTYRSKPSPLVSKIQAPEDDRRWIHALDAARRRIRMPEVTRWRIKASSQPVADPVTAIIVVLIIISQAARWRRCGQRGSRRRHCGLRERRGGRLEELVGE